MTFEVCHYGIRHCLVGLRATDEDVMRHWACAPNRPSSIGDSSTLDVILAILCGWLRDVPNGHSRH
jgi:hypothetical protein